MYSSGANYCGQCGCASSKDQLMTEIDYKPQLQSLFALNTTIVDIQSTYNTTIFKTDDCVLYGFGNGAYGCLGTEEERENHAISRVGTGTKEFIGERCLKFSCGLFFVAAITEIGQDPAAYKDACQARAKQFDTQIFIQKFKTTLGL